MDAHALIQRLLAPERASAQAIISAIREHGAERGVEVVCRTVGLQRVNAASVVLDAVQGEGADEVEQDLRRIAGAR